ncbi:potassium channel family protein [Bacteroidota bacterium]
MAKLRIKNIASAYTAIALLFLVIIVGLSGYSLLGFTIVEAFYQTVITIATVGFKEVHPLNDTGMIFTAFLIIFSFGIFAYAVTTLTRYIVEGVYRNTIKDTKVKRKIDRLSDHVVICGYGRNGKQAATELIDHNVPTLIVEKDAELIQSIRSMNDILYIEGDAVDEEVLMQCRLPQARALITTLPVDADNLFVVLTAKEINPSLRVISRASVDHADVKLKRAGATNVIMPDKVGGQRMAKLVAQPNIVEFIDYMLLQSTENVVLDEISCTSIASSFEGKSIRELDIKNQSGANIIGLRKEDKSYLINPLPETEIHASDRIFVLGTRRQIDNLKKLISREQD